MKIATTGSDQEHERDRERGASRARTTAGGSLRWRWQEPGRQQVGLPVAVQQPGDERLRLGLVRAPLTTAMP